MLICNLSSLPASLPATRLSASSAFDSVIASPSRRHHLLSVNASVLAQSPSRVLAGAVFSLAVVAHVAHFISRARDTAVSASSILFTKGLQDISALKNCGPRPSAFLEDTCIAFSRPVRERSSISSAAMAPVSISPRSIAAPIQSRTDYTSFPPPSIITDPELSSLAKRVIPVVSIPATYGGLTSGPTPGTVAGIVLGTVSGVLLVLYVFYLVLCRHCYADVSEVSSEIVYRRRPRGPETVERPRAGPPAPRPRSRRDNTVVVEESETSRTTEDDIVEVIEEHSTMSPSTATTETPPPRRSKARGKQQFSGSYRTVDPYEYGGGRAPARHVRR